MTQPRTEHGAVSEYTQACREAQASMEMVAASVPNRYLEELACVAADAIGDVLTELRRIPKETGDQT